MELAAAAPGSPAQGACHKQGPSVSRLDRGRVGSSGQPETSDAGGPEAWVRLSVRQQTEHNGIGRGVRRELIRRTGGAADEDASACIGRNAGGLGEPALGGMAARGQLARHRIEPCAEDPSRSALDAATDHDELPVRRQGEQVRARDVALGAAREPQTTRAEGSIRGPPGPVAGEPYDRCPLLKDARPSLHDPGQPDEQRVPHAADGADKQLGPSAPREVEVASGDGNRHGCDSLLCVVVDREPRSADGRARYRALGDHDRVVEQPPHSAAVHRDVAQVGDLRLA